MSTSSRPEDTATDLTYKAALIERLRPAFIRADTEWLLDEEEVIDTIVETGGDTTWLARDLNLQADLCVMT